MLLMHVFNVKVKARESGRGLKSSVNAYTAVSGSGLEVVNLGVGKNYTRRRCVVFFFIYFFFNMAET